MNQTQKVDILFKKFLNTPSGYLGQPIHSEIPLMNRSYVISDIQILSDKIPTKAPTDLSDDNSFSASFGIKKYSYANKYIKKYIK